MSLNYFETKIFLSSEAVEPVTALLLRYGIEQTVIEDIRDIRNIAETKGTTDWDFVEESLLSGSDEVTITFYTEENDAGKELLSAIKIDIMKLKSDEQYGKYGANIDFGRLHTETAPLSDGWKDSWKDWFKTFKPTERFVIKPTWENYDPEDGEFVIELDPGMAFGTGTHETTSMCLAALEKYVRPDDTVMDIGAGSGILSIASAMLGADRIIAVEIDEDAANAAEKNIEMNHLTGKIELVKIDIREYDTASLKVDVIVANLTSGLLKTILPDIVHLIRKGGHLILSGLLDREIDEMIKAVESSGFKVLVTEIKGEWLSICAEYS